MHAPRTAAPVGHPLDAALLLLSAVVRGVASAGRFLAGRWATVRRTAEAGMSTAEYAIGTVAACGFAGVLWAVVHSDAVARLLQGVVERALSLAQ